ncbi:MAG: bifunctional (p)ppGpp synthetase/guanosine-3',5'-bis(diphosphate) 3'-pyrophosphohydrolase [bacterium]
MKLEDLEEKIGQFLPRVDRNKLRNAYQYALEAHGDQKRESGEPYIQHPLGVAAILSELEVDEPTLLAALLHDVVEDTSIPLEEIRRRFTEEVANLVDGVTKFSSIAYASRQEHQIENLRKMLLAMARDVRVVLIKLADRLHNLRTLNYLSVEKQREIARETLEIYAPLASRLGIYKLKWELEDLSFRYTEPEFYFDLARRMQRRRSERERILKDAQALVERDLADHGVLAQTQYRAKHLYSIQQKMLRDRLSFEEIYDLLALRVIVRDIPMCYEVLGIVHAIFTPIPGRLHDYIAMPKPNMYQSLHTVVIGPEGEPLEFQIRTEEMHRASELGIAAHWRYKEGGKRDIVMEQKLVWLRELLNWQKEVPDSREFLERVKVDLFADEVLVFTPKGEVINLPMGASPVDFAFQIHSQVGQHCAGAKVNGKIVSLDYKLQTGDRVEILTRRNASPSLDWLQFVRATSTKGKIRAYFRRLKKEESLALGKSIYERVLRKHLGAARFADALRILGLIDEEALFLALGQGQLAPAQILTALNREEQKAAEEAHIVLTKPQERPVQVTGTEGVLVRLARCCHPLPGDEIIGYTTQGRGISIHRQTCHSLAKLPEAGRRVSLSWPEGLTETHYVSELFLRAANRPGVLREITTAISEEGINIEQINAYPLPSELTGISLVVVVKDVAQLNQLMQKLERIPSINEVRRI